jgi:hypothetical protein
VTWWPIAPRRDRGPKQPVARSARRAEQSHRRKDDTLFEGVDLTLGRPLFVSIRCRELVGLAGAGSTVGRWYVKALVIIDMLDDFHASA